MADGGTVAELLWGVGALALVGSALLARRLPVGQSVKMALAWIAIFTLLFAIFSFRPEISMVVDRMRAELTGEAEQRVTGQEVRLRLGEDGHYHARVTINGKPADLMIDSGATFTAFSIKRARALGIAVNTNGYGHPFETANGTVKAYPATIDRFTLGPIERRDMTIFVSDSFGDTEVLGMNFLASLGGWRVERGEMILTP